MKFSLLLISLLFFLSVVPTFANTVVTTGNATSTVQVNNSVNGNADVTTHIETNVNGDEKVIDTSGSGSVDVQHTDNSYSITTSPQLTIIPTATPSSESVKLNYFAKPTSHSLWTAIKNFFVNLFHFF